MNNYQLSIKNYPFYKDSGVEWLGDVPEHWLSIRIKDVIKYIDQGWSPNAENRAVEEDEWGVLKLSAISNGKYYEINHKALPDTTELKPQYVVKKGALLITRSNTPELVGDCCLVLVEPALKLMYSDLVYCLRIKPRKILDRYLNYFLCSASFRWLKTVSARGLNTSMVKISQGIICRWSILAPPLPEQKTIAHYLDTKTAQIDHKIDLLTQKATLYSNLKQSLINETVTRGLDKSVPMKDSAIEWLGEVPEHWEVKHLKNIAEIKGGRDSKEVEHEEGAYPIYGSGGIFGRASKFLHKKTSVLLGRKGTIDKPLFVTEPFWSVDTMFYTDIKKSIYPKFFYYQCLTIQFGLYQYGSAVPSMAQNVLRQILFATPSYSEQKAIADYLDTKTAQIDQIIQTINTQIEKLKELRKTLINDVVTGKIRTRIGTD